MSIADAHRTPPPIAPASASREPVGRQIYHRLRQLIRHGRLPAGARQLSTRQLASDFGVSRNTVVFAHEELKAEGYILSEVGAGSPVAPPSRRGPLDRLSFRERPAPVRAGGLPPNINEPGYRIGQPFDVDLPALDVFPQKLWAKLAADRCARSLHELLRSEWHRSGHLREDRQSAVNHLVRCREADPEIGGCVHQAPWHDEYAAIGKRVP